MTNPNNQQAASYVTDAEILKAAGSWVVTEIGVDHVVRICRQVLQFASSRAASAQNAAPPTVEQATVALVDALVQSKGWLRDYADAIVRDAIDRKDAALVALQAEAAPLMRACANGFSQHPGRCDAWCGNDRTCPKVRFIKGSMSQVPDIAAPEQGDAKDANQLTPGEAKEVLEYLQDHDGSDFEPECPACTAFVKLVAIATKGQA